MRHEEAQGVQVRGETLLMAGVQSLRKTRKHTHSGSFCRRVPHVDSDDVRVLLRCQLLELREELVERRFVNKAKGWSRGVLGGGAPKTIGAFSQVDGVLGASFLGSGGG